MVSHRVYRSLNKPLTVLGVERRLFFFLLTVAVALFNISGALLPAVGLFVALLLLARGVTGYDPQFLRIVAVSNRFAARYDPGKFSADVQMKGGVRDARPYGSVKGA